MDNLKSPYTIKINKPLYETKTYDAVGIWDYRVSTAYKNRQSLKVISKNGEEIFDPLWVMKNCKTFKKIYQRPNEPMVEYKILIPRRKEK